MQKVLWLLTMFCMFAVALANDGTSESVAATETRTFKVTYSNGSSEMYEAKYVGVLRATHTETGNTNFYDDRQCHWNLQNRIERQVFVNHISGRQLPFEQLQTTWRVPFTNEGSDFVLTDFSPENCGEAQTRYLSDVNNARQALANTFSSTVSQDLETFQTALEEQLGDNVTVEDVGN